MKNSKIKNLGFLQRFQKSIIDFSHYSKIVFNLYFHSDNLLKIVINFI